MSTVTLTNPNVNSGTAVKVHCQKVIVGWQNNTFSKSTPGDFTVSEVQKNSFDNPTIALQAVNLVDSTISGDANSLTYAQLLSFAKNEYDGTSGTQTTLNITYGDSTQLVGSDGSTTAIPVEIESFNMTMDTTDSDDAYVPTITITVRETA